MSEPRRPGRPRKASLNSPSPARLGVVKVGDDFADEYPDGNSLSAEATATLVRTGAAIAQEIERAMLATFDVAQPALNSLAIIDGAGQPLTPSEISERTLMSSASMTGILDTLELRGWVRRLPNPDDRRSVLVEITDDGKAVTDQLLPGIRKLELVLCADLSDSEQRTLVKLLGKVLAGAATIADAEPIALEGRRKRPKRLQ